MNEIKTKLPPCDLDAEKSILSAILLDNDAIMKSMEIITADDFYHRANHNIYQCMLKLFERTEATDILTLAQELKKQSLFEATGGKEYLESLLLVVPSAAAVGQYCKIVRQKSVLRQLIKGSSGILERCYDDSYEIDELLDQAEESIFKISESKSSSNVRHISDVIDSSFAQIEALYDNKQLVSGIPTGFKGLDDVTSGLQKGNLVIVAARPGMGKTSFCLNIALNSAETSGTAVLLFSLEMSSEELGIRLLCSEARVDSNKLKTGYWGAGDWDKLTGAAAKLCDLDILIDDTANLNVLEIRARTRRAKAMKPNLGLIIVDYLQLMKGLRNVDRHLEIAEISRSLKALAKELEVPIIALSQLSRAVESRSDKKPQLSDLRESGAIEQDADIVMFIYRPEMYEQDNEELKNVAELLVAKNRSGPTGEFKLTFLKQFTRFENYAPDQPGGPQPRFDSLASAGRSMSPPDGMEDDFGF